MPTALAFEHATEHTVAVDAVRVDRTLVVRDGRIEALGPSTALQPPTDAQRIDATGWHLLPGLADMHVHLATMGVGPTRPPRWRAARSAQVLKVYLLHGVTTVRSMAAGVWHTVEELATALAEPFA